MAAIGVSTQTTLSTWLGVRQSNISDAIRNDAVPDVWLYKVAYATGRRVEWLRTGEAPEFFSEAVAETQHRYGLEEEAVRLYLTRRRDLCDDQRRIIDRLMDLLLRTDDETREAVLLLIAKLREPSR